MNKQPIVDREILSILDDYRLFIDSDKRVDMPFRVDAVDKKGHSTSLVGLSDLSADKPFGSTVLECEMRDRSEYRYTFRILSDAIKRRVLFRMDEGGKTHRNWHLPVPVDKQQVPTPHFHIYADDGIMYAYRTEVLERITSPLHIRKGFVAFCDEIHINQKDRRIVIQEEGALPLEFTPEVDPLADIQFP